MQAKHPIDDLFHSTLAQAEATPPPDLFARVLDSRSGRRRGAAWWWKAGSLFLLGSTIVGAITMYQMGVDPAATTPLAMVPHDGQELVTTSRIEGPSPSDRSGPAQENAEALTAMTTGKGVGPAKDRAARMISGTGPAGTIVTSSMPLTGSMGNTLSAHGDPSADPTKGASIAWAGVDETATPMERRSTHLPTTPSGVPVGAARTQGYVLPRGDWWVGARADVLNETRTWSGANTRLVDALNAAEAPSTFWSLGFVGGRTWRSGLNLGTGVLYERSERAFNTTYRTRVTEQEITSYFVTLNDQVFVSDVDTLTTSSYRDERVEGIYQRALLRIPVEFGWRYDLKRWSIIPKLGLMLELNLQRQGLSLDQANEGGPLVAAKLDPDAMRQRHPDLLLAMVGAEASYLLGERWRISAAPVVLWTALPLGTQGTQPVSIPQRSGMEFSLTYTLPSAR